MKSPKGMYGAGAILVRETVRLNGGGWPSILLLACAFGLLEEDFVTQSLFNPDYLHLRLLDFGFLPSLGTAFPWAIFVVSIHAVWSITVPWRFPRLCLDPISNRHRAAWRHGSRRTLDHRDLAPRRAEPLSASSVQRCGASFGG
jgi:hypothetical protein